MGLSVFARLGLLVFSMLGVLVALGLAVLLSIGPSGEGPPLPDARAPQAPAVALGDAQPVKSGGGAGIGHGKRVAGGAATLAGDEVEGRHGSGAPAQVVSAGLPVEGSAPAQSPPTATPGPAPDAPAAVPVSEPVPETPAAVPVSVSEPAPSDAPPWLHHVAGFANGSNPSVFRLVGDEGISRLFLDGEGGIGASEDALQIFEGEQYAFAFSFYIESMVYAEPGTENLILRLQGDAADTPGLSLQLWSRAGDDGQGGGLWSSGRVTRGPRFLGPVAEREWHDVVVSFRASARGAGFYEIYLDGALTDARGSVSLLSPGSSYAQIEVGLIRDSSRVQGTSEIRIGATELGDTPEPVLP